jgi:RimJ/RimL family protein N-acetyltransferase
VGSLHLLLQGRRRGIAEVGVWVAPHARRSGAATGSIAAMLAWAEPALGLARMEWNATPDNLASIALAERLGFVRESLARSALPGTVPSERDDSVVLARLVG